MNVFCFFERKIVYVTKCMHDEWICHQWIFIVMCRALVCSLSGALRSRIRYRLCIHNTMQHTATLSNRRRAAVAKRTPVVCREYCGQCTHGVCAHNTIVHSDRVALHSALYRVLKLRSLLFHDNPLLLLKRYWDKQRSFPKELRGYSHFSETAQSAIYCMLKIVIMFGIIEQCNNLLPVWMSISFWNRYNAFFHFLFSISVSIITILTEKTDFSLRYLIMGYSDARFFSLSLSLFFSSLLCSPHS